MQRRRLLAALIALYFTGLCFVPSVPPHRARISARLTSRHARAQDLLSGETFSRKAIFLLETEQPLLQSLIFGSAFIALTAFSGLVYNGLGQLALLTTPGAKPGLDETQVVFGEGFAVVAGMLSFANLTKARTRNLRALDAELAFGGLKLVLMDGTSLERKLSELAKDRRVLVLFASDKEKLHESLLLAEAYRRRWLTSKVLVVAAGEVQGGGGRWLARAQNPEAWSRCYAAWQDVSGQEPSSTSWLLFGRSGRLRGQSSGRDFDQILAFVGVGQNLSLLPQRAQESEKEVEILKVHDDFYVALKSGDAPLMRTLWEEAGEEKDSRPRVSWEEVLSDKAAVLDVVDVDVVRLGKSEAMVTSIEVCAGEGSLFNDGGPGGKGTLLATKRLKLEESGSWRLVSHQTIPYCDNTVASQSLVCTSRGCILLKRE